MPPENMTRRKFLQMLGWGAAGFTGLGLLGSFSGRPVLAHPAIKPAFLSEIRNGDFEDGLNGWHAEPAQGSAFENQPVQGRSIKAAEVDPRLVSIGGNYWRNTSFHVGYSGNYLIKSNPGLAGILWSDPFAIPKLAVSLSFLIGGGLGLVKLQRLIMQDEEFEGETENSVLHAGTWVSYHDRVTANPSASLIMEERTIPFGDHDQGKVLRIVVETFRNSITPFLVDNFHLDFANLGAES